MPRHGAFLNDAAVPVPARPAPDMSFLPYAAVRRMARHTWFHGPVFPFVHFADLRPSRPRRSTPATTPGVSGSRPACAGAAGHVRTIRLAARPNLGRLSQAHDIGGFDFPPPRRRNSARPGLSGQMGTARDSYLDGGALRPGAVTSPALSQPPGGPSRSSPPSRDRADLAVGATSARGGQCTSALCAPPVKPAAGCPPGPAIRPSPGERAQVSWWFVFGRDAESHR
jgi:hypothetical protein